MKQVHQQELESGELRERKEREARRQAEMKAGQEQKAATDAKVRENKEREARRQAETKSQQNLQISLEDSIHGDKNELSSDSIKALEATGTTDGETPKPQLPSSRPVIALKRIIKWCVNGSERRVWGFNENCTFRKLDPGDLLEKCPSCGSGPIKWSAIRNKTNHNCVSRLRCNRQAKGTCDHPSALRRTKRKQMMRAAANRKKSRLSSMDQACKLMKDAVRLFQLADKTTLSTYISKNEIPAEIHTFMMQFLADSPGDAIPEMVPPQLFRSSGATPAPEPSPLQRLALALQPHSLVPKSHKEKPTPSLWNLNTPADTYPPFESGRFGRFSAGMGLDVGVNPGWNAPSIDFKSLGLNMGVGSKSSSSSQNMTGAMPQEQEPNSLNMSLGVVVEKSITDERLCAATRAGRTHTSHNTHVLLQQLALTRRIRAAAAANVNSTRRKLARQLHHV